MKSNTLSRVPVYLIASLISLCAWSGASKTPPGAPEDLIVRWVEKSGRKISFATGLKVEFRKIDGVTTHSYPTIIPFPGVTYTTHETLHFTSNNGTFVVKDFYKKLASVPAYQSVEIWTYHSGWGFGPRSTAFMKVSGLIGPNLKTEPVAMTTGDGCRIKAYGSKYRKTFLKKRPVELVCVASD